jgi:phospholipid/cholesterol/gamma-HCH transport system substrate-binding protein
MAKSVRRRNLEWRQLRVVLLIAISIVLLAYGVYQVGKVFDVFASRYELVTTVPTALGLREGAPVTLAGQRIGQVKRIEFIPVDRKTSGDNLRITLAIAHEVRDQIRRDSRAFLRTQGLLGDKFVDIEPGTAGNAVLIAGDTLRAGKSLDIEEFMTQASAALDEATAVVEALRSVTTGLANGEGTIGQLLTDEQLYGRMVSTTGQLEGVLRQINSSNGTLGHLIRDPALYQRLTSTVSRVDSLGAAILYGDGSMARLIRSDSLYRSLAGTAFRADSAMGGVAGIVSRLERGEGSIQKLMNDPALYDQFLKSVIDLQSLIEAIRTDPEKFKPKIDVHVKVF